MSTSAQHMFVHMSMAIGTVIDYIKRNISNNYISTEAEDSGKSALEFAVRLLMLYRHEIKNSFKDQDQAGLEDIKKIIEDTIKETHPQRSDLHIVASELGDTIGKMITEKQGIPEATGEEVQMLLGFFKALEKRTKTFFTEN